MKLRAIFFWLFSVGLCLLTWQYIAYAEDEKTPPTGLTLDKCIEIAIKRSTEILNARRDEEIAESRIRQVRSQVFPQLDAEAGYMRLDEAGGIPDTPIVFGRTDNYSAGLNASQLLYSGGAVHAAMNAAGNYREMSRLDVATRQRLVVRDVTRAFYEILFAHTRIAVSRQSVLQLEEFEKEAHLKYTNGTISEFDWLSAKVSLANERPKVVRDRNSFAIAKADFAKMLHFEDDNFNLIGKMEFKPVRNVTEELLVLGMERRPELLASATRIELSENDMQITRAKLLPELRARATYEGKNPDQQNMSAADNWGWHWNAGFDLTWNVLDGGLRRAQLMEKTLTRDKAKADYSELGRQVRLEIKRASLFLRHAREIVESSGQTVDLAQKAYDIAEVRYTKGLSTYLEFTDSNLALSQAKMNQALAITRYLQALADLRFACGVERLPGEEQE